PIRVPPLRERREDIPSLVKHFVERYRRQMNRSIRVISPETIDAFCKYQWPGNIRELENFLERTVILSKGATLDAPLEELTQLSESAPEPVTLRDAERAHIVRTLRVTNGVIATAAVRLGLPRSTLFYKMRRLGIGSPANGRRSGFPQN